MSTNKRIDTTPGDRDNQVRRNKQLGMDSAAERLRTCHMNGPEHQAR